MLALAGAAISSFPLDARADEPPPQRIELRHRIAIDLPVTVGLWGGAVAWIASRDPLIPSECRFCDGSEPGEVNAVDELFRDAFRRRDTGPAATMSHVLAYSVAPITSVGLGGLAAFADDRADELPLNMLLVAQATGVAVVVTETIKPLTLRERPDVHAMEGDARADALQEAESLLSFPSGHTCTTFAIASAGGTIASMRGYRLAPMVWISGMMIAATTGYMRMAADRHYFTDVLAGGALGTAIGAAVPLLFHSPKGRSGAFAFLGHAMIGTEAIPGGRIVTIGGLF